MTLQCSLARLHPANRLLSASDPFYMESVTMTCYAGIGFPSALSAHALPSPLGLMFRIPNLVIPGLANYRSRLGLPCLLSAYGMYWKPALICGDLLSQTTAHTVIWSIQPPLPQRYTSIAFIFPYSLMVRLHLLLELFTLLYGKVLVLYWLGFWYGTAVYCRLCSRYFPGLRSCI